MAPKKNNNNLENERGLARKWRKEGKTNKEISKLLGRSVRWVQTWCNNKRTSVKDRSRSGRPTKLGQAEKSQITALMKGKAGRSHRKIAKLMNNSDRAKAKNLTISPSTVVRYAKSQDWGKTSYKIQSVPLLDGVQRDKRMSVCGKWLRQGFLGDNDKGNFLRHSVLWTDESWIQLFPPPNKQNDRVRCEHREDVPVKRSVKFPPKILVAGGMTAGGLTDLHIVPKGKTIDGEYYREEILKKVYFPALKKDGMFPDPSSQAILQQDGATPHTAKLSQDLCDELFPIVWKKADWPGNSPDMNPVEKTVVYLKGEGI